VELIRFDDVGDFLERVEPELLAREAEHSLLLGSAYARRAAGAGATAPYLAVVRDDGLALAALLAGARPLLLASDRSETEDAVGRLAADLVRAGLHPTGAHGRAGLAERFARAWGEATGARWRLAMRQRLHALSEPRPVRMAPGELRPAGASDLPLLEEWVIAFEREALGKALGGPDADRLRAAAARRLAAGELFVWEDGAPRAMAASARPTRGTIAVNAVYTPPSERGRGYATACVARLSERLLAAGARQCVLFTDLANPTSNAIYAKIGYRGVADFELSRAE
jgi:predicted GNAT family acetyltransferase